MGQESGGRERLRAGFTGQGYLYAAHSEMLKYSLLDIVTLDWVAGEERSAGTISGK